MDKFLKTILPGAIAFYVGARIATECLDALSAHRSASSFSPGYPPVAVFVGGTAGIGRAMASSLGRYTDGNASIVIIGRNRTAAESILSRLPKPSNPTVKHEFIQCDVTRMKNVHTATQELLSRYPKINFLVLTAGFMSMGGREETEEGLDAKLAAHYYSRWKFIDGLLPAIRKAQADEEDAKVISVFSAGKGKGEIDLNDLGLKKNYTLTRAAKHAATYNDLMLDEFASRNPGLTFLHSYPGMVPTNLLRSSDSTLLQVAGPLLNTVLYPILTTPQTCAQRMWSGIFAHKGGAYQLGSDGRSLLGGAFHGTNEQRQKLWDHTVEATKYSDH